MTDSDYYTKFKRKCLAETLNGLRWTYGRDCECGGFYQFMIELQESDELVRAKMNCRDCGKLVFDRVVADPDELLVEEPS